MSGPAPARLGAQAAAPAKPVWRQRLLWGGLLLSLAATAWVSVREDAAGEEDLRLQARPAAVSPGTATGMAPARTAVASLRSGWPPALPVPAAGAAWPDASEQVLESWGLRAAQPARPEPQPTAAPPAAAAPSPADAAPAPPLDYQWVGRMDEGQRPRIVLSNALRTVVLGVGETLDQQWRLDAIGPNGAQFTWLAGGQKQSLAFAASSLGAAPSVSSP